MMLAWRKGWDSNPRGSCPPGGFQDRCLKPLGHPSSALSHAKWRWALQAAYFRSVTLWIRMRMDCRRHVHSPTCAANLPRSTGGMALQGWGECVIMADDAQYSIRKRLSGLRLSANRNHLFGRVMRGAHGLCCRGGAGPNLPRRPLRGSWARFV